MLKVFHTFKAYQLLRLVNMSAICRETMHLAGRGLRHGFMILRCEAATATSPETPVVST